MGWIWALIVGAIIGAVAGSLTGKGGGLLSNIIAGLVGSSLGQWLLGSWGPSLAGMALVPSILGAAILITLVSFIFGRAERSS